MDYIIGINKREFKETSTDKIADKLMRLAYSIKHGFMREIWFSFREMPTIYIASLIVSKDGNEFNWQEKKFNWQESVPDWEKWILIGISPATSKQQVEEILNDKTEDFLFGVEKHEIQWDLIIDEKMEQKDIYFNIVQFLEE